MADTRPRALHLRHRLAALGARRLVAGAGALSHERALALARRTGALWARLGGPRVRTAHANLRIAFPEWSEAERRRVARRSLESLAQGLAEFLRLPRTSEAELAERVTIEGLEHLEAARAASSTGGVLAMTGHFGNWELLAAAMSARGFPVAVVHRARENPLLDRLVGGLRASGGTELHARGAAARAVLRALREGKIVAMPYDQNAPRREGVFVPFFGRLACARDAPARVALRTGTPVLPVFLHRAGPGGRHVARVRPAITPPEEAGERAEAARALAERMTRVLEAEIRLAPEQWVWIHRRFRTTPPGEPHPYTTRRRKPGARLAPARAPSAR